MADSEKFTWNSLPVEELEATRDDLLAEVDFNRSQNLLYEDLVDELEEVNDAIIAKKGTHLNS